MKSGVYFIINLVNGKKYVGSSNDIRQRRREHWSHLKQNIHSNKHLQNAWNTYGEKNFMFLIQEFVSKDQLLDREQYWLDMYKTFNRNIGYNISSLSKTRLGVKQPKAWCEWKSKIMLGNTLNKNRKFSKEWCKNISLGGKGKQPKIKKRGLERKPVSMKTRKCMSKSRKLFWQDKKRSAIAREKLININKHLSVRNI